MDETDRRAELSDFQRLKMSRRLWVQHARTVLWPVDPAYSFRGQTARSNEMNDVTDLNWWVTRLYRKVRKTQADLYMRGIARGIAMHHSGLNKAYRDMVEAFIRSGIITVVIATKSLAVGVNFPIRTSVFLDSGRYMDSTSFKQMCGRAGRRGFDDCGYVVTIGLHLAHLATLVIAPAQKLNIPHGLDVNSLLRIMIMRQGKPLGTKKSIDTATENSSYVQNVVKRWMLVPQQSTVSLTTTGAMWGYHFFHQLLYRLKLVDGYSNPIGLAGLVSHCGEHYPANLAFAYMLLTGSLSSVLVVDNKPGAISSPTSNNERLRALSLVYVSVMSHTMKWHDHGETDRTVAAYTLPQVPPNVQEGLAQYNRLVHSTFRDCERVFGTSGADMYGPYLPVMPTTQNYRNGYLYLFMNGTQYGTVVDHCQMTDKSLYARLTRELLFMRKVTTSLSLCLDDTDPIVADMKVLTHAFQANYDAIEY
ncbi:hypothetical protein SARC_10109 [Sphaeroforma arctica JP610]|uniref:Helicase C-terminal domain-containing protein n=1 Tax=Sphaeroforma arctica JP610 TaxID=667725 RepID=A0A0L0FKX9_9EUKA|nr:hypothetical protein SARC_10109 [Sphaeroforma arctica JP610]KNC77430.1 hypothetical protein SARC_10109 [Sphaeroforma arctica JP610]|eukprot:XP_014151332.1 hypothetical protein SARC_10109 [Sphaeroforma arctica JP610]